jgi:hypothetical protein
MKSIRGSLLLVLPDGNLARLETKTSVENGHLELLRSGLLGSVRVMKEEGCLHNILDCRHWRSCVCCVATPTCSGP